ncbi:hypothetical protein BREVNS_1181 [Brevinematales bacterium NS]|nr:hypothetical protein BREVNS_1181 [Brevinematales bacterium NS]
MKLNTYFHISRPLHGCFLPLSGSGATPLKPRFFCLQGPICLFLLKKVELFIMIRNIFILFLFFYYFFETFAHSCKGLISYEQGKETTQKLSVMMPIEKRVVLENMTARYGYSPISA